MNDDPNKAESCDLSLRDAWSVLLAWLRRLLEGWFWETVPEASHASEPTSWAGPIRPPATRSATVFNERRHHRAERRAAPPTSIPSVSRMCEDCKKVRDDVKESRFMVALCDECYIARAFGHELHPLPRFEFDFRTNRGHFLADTGKRDAKEAGVPADTARPLPPPQGELQPRSSIPTDVTVKEPPHCVKCNKVWHYDRNERPEQPRPLCPDCEEENVRLWIPQTEYRYRTATKP
jgi:hypothetical protein